MVNLLLLSSRSAVSDSVTPWTVTHQAPLSWASPGQNPGVGHHFLLQGTFPTQGLNPPVLRLRTAGRLFTADPPGKLTCLDETAAKVCVPQHARPRSELLRVSLSAHPGLMAMNGLGCASCVTITCPFPGWPLSATEGLGVRVVAGVFYDSPGPLRRRSWLRTCQPVQET